MLSNNKSFDNRSSNKDGQNGLMNQVAAKLKGLDEAAAGP